MGALYPLSFSLAFLRSQGAQNSLPFVVDVGAVAVVFSIQC